MSEDLDKISLENGKYEVEWGSNGKEFIFQVFRYKEYWKSLIGDNLALCMAQRIQQLEENNRKLQVVLEEARTHYLKLEQPYFSQVKEGKLKFNVRKNDRGYREGDTLVFSRKTAETKIMGQDFHTVSNQWEKITKVDLSNTIKAKVTSILDDERWVKEGYVVLGFELVEE